MAVDLVLGLADRAYQQGDWAAALNFYRNVLAMDAAGSAERGYRLTISHCEIELAAPDALAALAPDTDPSSGSERERVLVARLRVRARDLCRAGDFARAAPLLRLLTRCDPPIAETYAQSIDASSSRIDRAADDRDPPFLAALADLDVAAVKARMRGRRVLLVFRRLYYDMPERCYEPPDLFARSAEAFGLKVAALDASALDHDPAGFGTRLLEHINAARPDVILFDGLFTGGPSADDPTTVLHVETVLDVARRRLGARVVNCMLHAWRLSDRQMFQGLGRSVDLVQHCHPEILDRASAAERAATFCYVPPLDVPGSTAEATTIPQACMAGTIADGNIARLVWWAEAGARGLPVAMFETNAAAPAERPDAAFADLHRTYQVALNVTRRAGGGPILTLRTIQTLLAGGVLLEEESRDSAYFLKPGVHYVPFATLADAAGSIESLLRDPARRARLAQAGQAWARRYFTGDYFWAGLLQRALGAPR